MKINRHALVLAAALLTLTGLTACSSDTEKAPAPAVSETPEARPTNGSFTMADVEAHATAEDCWTTINTKVYDLTKWVGYHPGGPDYITMLCGKDGSSMFMSRHGGQPAPADALQYYVIGSITDTAGTTADTAATTDTATTVSGE